MTYLVLFAGSGHARLSKTLCDGLAAEVVHIRFRDVVKLALEQFSGSVFGFAFDFADARDAIDDTLQRRP